MNEVLIDSNVLIDICNGYKKYGVTNVNINILENVITKLNLDIEKDLKKNFSIIIKDFELAKNLDFNILNKQTNYKKINDAYVKMLSVKNISLKNKITIFRLMEQNYSNFKECVTNFNFDKLDKIFLSRESLYKDGKKIKLTKQQFEELLKKEEIIKLKFERDCKQFISKSFLEFDKLSENKSILFDRYSNLNALKALEIAKNRKCKWVVLKDVEKELLTHVPGTIEYHVGNRNMRRRAEAKAKYVAGKKGVNFDIKEFRKSKSWILPAEKELTLTNVNAITKIASSLSVEENPLKCIERIASVLQDKFKLSDYRNRQNQNCDSQIYTTACVSGRIVITNNTKDFSNNILKIVGPEKFDKLIDEINQMSSLTAEDVDKKLGEFIETTTKNNLSAEDDVENILLEEINKIEKREHLPLTKKETFKPGGVVSVEDFVYGNVLINSEKPLLNLHIVEDKKFEYNSLVNYETHEVLMSKSNNSLNKDDMVR